jgi:ferredoxin
VCGVNLENPGAMRQPYAWLLALRAAIVAAASFSLPTPRSWDVTLIKGTERHVLTVPETMSVLQAAEEAGLLPGSDCRRGNCLSCAARVVDGEPYTLRVEENTALCTECHTEGIVLLCSAFPCGPGLELALGADGDAWQLQYEGRWRRTSPKPAPREQRPATPHFHDPEDLRVHLERCNRRSVEDN